MNEDISRRDLLKISTLALARIVLPRDLMKSTEVQSTWEVPTVEERKILFADPAFWSTPQGENTRELLSPQFKDEEYNFLPDTLHELKRFAFKNHTCSEAILTTLSKLFIYLDTGEVPNLKISDTVLRLMNAGSVTPGTLEMIDSQLAKEIRLLDRRVTVSYFTKDWDPQHSRIAAASDWPEIFAQLKKTLDAGGLGVARVTKYGQGVAHFILISSMNDKEEPMIIDSIGPEINGHRDGKVSSVPLEEYADKWHGQPGLIWMAGVTW
ncbi:hypothetical protein BH10PAT2_BH10PAT2_0700 [soil metagenome]